MVDAFEPEGRTGSPAGGPLEQRVADADRDRTVTLLREHVVVGRLTLDEFSERVGLALEARTRGDLEATLANLPDLAIPQETSVRRKARHWFIGFMSGSGAKGRWRISGNTTAIAVMGGCDLDLRHAEIDGPEVVITAVAFMGGVQITVPEGFDVEMNVFPFMGGRELKLRNVPIIPGSPRIRIRGFAMMGGVEVRSRPTRSGREIGKNIVDHVLNAVDTFPTLAGSSSGPIDIEALGREIRDQIRAQRRSGNQQRNQRHQRENEQHQWENQHRDNPRDRHRDSGWAREAREDSAPPEAASPPAPPAPTAPATEAPIGDTPRPGEGTVTILFSDMVNYAGITERLGDQASRELLRDHHQIVRELLANHGGREIKVQGDGFMVAFGGVARALRCAADMQRAFNNYSEGHRDRPIQIHIGVHTGEAMEEDDDFLGHTVIVASRLADVAAPGEVLVSSLSALLVERTEEFQFVDFRETSLKGLTRPHQVATLVWEG
jgi:class 3 adenylate cyclase